MKLPGRMIDLSSPLENETVYDHPFMRPKIEYLTGADTAPTAVRAVSRPAP